MRRSRSRDTAAIQIAFQRKDDAMHVGVIAEGVNQASLTQDRQRVAGLHQPGSQAAARCVADAHVLDQFRRADSALLQIGHRLNVAV
jgi:hypothetical protein